MRAGNKILMPRPSLVGKRSRLVQDLAAQMRGRRISALCPAPTLNKEIVVVWQKFSSHLLVEYIVSPSLDPKPRVLPKAHLACSWLKKKLLKFCLGRWQPRTVLSLSQIMTTRPKAFVALFHSPSSPSQTIALVSRASVKTFSLLNFATTQFIYSHRSGPP